MKERDKGRFEQEWTNAFEGAALEPSEHVWNKVELSLANAANSSARKRLLVFKLLAAASVSFALSIGGWQWYKTQSNSLLEDRVVEIKGEESKFNNAPSSKNESTIEVGENELNSDEDKALSKKDNVSNKEDYVNEDYENNDPATNTNLYIAKAADDSKMLSVAEVIKENKSHTNEESLAIDENSFMLNKLESLAALLDLRQPKEVDILMVPWLSEANKRKSNNQRGNLWTGLAMSAGSFNPNSSVSDNPGSLNTFSDEAVANFSQASSTPQVILGEESSGSSFGIGLNIGTRLSNKMVLLSGLNYLQQNTSSRSNLVDAQNGFSVLSNSRELGEAESLAFTDTYEITNTYRLLSVPLQAGYYVLNRKFGVLLLAGISNDFFMERNSMDDSGQASGGEFNFQDEGYSLYSVGGLVGSQFSYVLGRHYSLAIQPQLRQSFNSYTPNGNKPSSFEVSFKLNYMIK